MPRATNSARMRKKNEKIILSLIAREPLSRADIAKETGLTKAAVTIIADELLRRGIITEEKSEGGSVGRTPLLLSLVPDSVFFIGVNIRRVGITVGICNLSGEVIGEVELPIMTPDDAFPRIAEEIRELIRVFGIPRERIYKAAIATPGPVDSVSGRILNPPNFEAWHGVDAASRLGEALGVDAILGNVSSAAASAELYFGSAHRSKDFLALIVDEGIGSGIVTNGRLFEGACELGHVSISYDGRRCECGNRGCLEKYASIPNILQGTPYSDWRSLIEADDREVILREAEYLGCAIATASNMFDLDTAILCGEISCRPEGFIPVLSDKTISKMIKKKDFTVTIGSVSSQSLTAAALAVYDFFMA